MKFNWFIVVVMFIVVTVNADSDLTFYNTRHYHQNRQMQNKINQLKSEKIILLDIGEVRSINLSTDVMSKITARSGNMFDFIVKLNDSTLYTANNTYVATFSDQYRDPCTKSNYTFIFANCQYSTDKIIIEYFLSNNKPSCKTTNSLQTTTMVIVSVIVVFFTIYIMSIILFYYKTTTKSKVDTDQLTNLQMIINIDSEIESQIDSDSDSDYSASDTESYHGSDQDEIVDID